MCGIVAYIGNKDPKSIILDGLERMEYRVMIVRGFYYVIILNLN